MIIRQATRQDSPYIGKLLIQLGYPNLSVEEIEIKINSYTQTGYQLLVAELDDLVIAFISLHWFDIFHSSGKIGRISAFCVDENFRSQQIGRQLLEYAEKFLLQQGCSKIEVTSNIKRLRSHDFYLMRGYFEDSKRFTKYPK
jgi:GNAT superfamily N-acetyltransferase